MDFVDVGVSANAKSLMSFGSTSFRVGLAGVVATLSDLSVLT